MDYNFYNKPITSCGWQTSSWFQLGVEIPGGYLRNHGYNPSRINSTYNNVPGPEDVWSPVQNTWQLVNYFGPNGTGYIPATPYELGGWTGGTAGQIVQAVNEGAFWLHNCGHGYTTGWATPSMNNSHVAQTTNVGKLTFVLMHNCSTGEFDSPSDCFTEAWMRHTYNGNNAGAVGVISSTRPSLFWSNELFGFGIYDFFENDFMPTYGTDTGNTGNWMPAFGNVAGKYFLSQTSWEHGSGANLYYLFTAHCDAFLRLYTQVPQETATLHPESIVAGQGEITISAPAGCVICLSKANQEGGVDILAVATATGMYQNITFEPQMAATEIKIVVTGQNYLRYEETMDVVSPEGAYLVLEDYTPHAAPVNQQTNLSMSIRNLGNMASSGMTTINLSASDERLNIVNGVATLGVIAPNETITLDNAFSFVIADGVQDGTEFPFEVTMSCGDETWTGYGVITAQQASFEYLGMSWPGGFVPGETLTVTATFKNIGHYEAVGAVAQIASTSPYVSFESETYEIGTVGVNEEIECSFNVSISPDCPETESIPLLFSINANGDVSAEASDLLRNTCNLIFNLYSSWDSGWMGNTLIVAFSDGSPSLELTILHGSTQSSYTVPIGEGAHVTLSWVSASYMDHCSFNVEYENGVIIYQETNLHAGLLYEFDMNCDDQFSPLNIAVSAAPAEGGAVTGGGAYEPGENCTITATPNENYAFAYWTENGVVVSTNSTYSFTVMANHNFIAHFMPPLAITVSPNIEEGGMVTGEGLYGYGETCTLTASANENYVFDYWTKNGTVVSYFSTYTFTVSEDANYVANFEWVPNGIAIGDAVSESNNLPSTSDWSSKFSLSQQIYTADEIGTACMITGVAFFNTGSQNILDYTIYMKHTDKNSFINGYDWIPVTEADKVFNGDIVMAAENWTYIDFDRPFYYDGSANIAMIVDENYISSSDMKCRVFNTGEYQYQSIRMSSSQINYDPTNLSGYYGTRSWNKNQIIFTQLMPSSAPVTITVNANLSEAGTVSGDGVYYLGDTCAVTATANEGYCFAHWTKNGNVVSSDADYSFVVVGESVLTAHFVPEGNIDFVDANVKAICVANWDTNGDGELSYVEAASVRSIGSEFRENTTITSFEELQYFIGLTSIYNYAFYNCSNLTGSLTIPNSVTLIGSSAFWGCSGLTSLTIGNSVTTIGGWAFSECWHLNAVYFMGNLNQWCDIQFGNDYSNYSNPLSYAHKLYINNELVTNLVIPESVTELKPYVFCGATCLTSLNIPNTVTSIGDYAFYGCSGLTGSLTIPNSVVSIGSFAFYGCWGLTGSLTIPNSVTSIGGDAFRDCSGFEGSLTLSNSVTSIGGDAFYGCSGLTGSLIIPNSVISIGDWAFGHCSGLTGSLIIPNSVTSMGYRAFQGCSGLTGSLTISNSLTSISLSAFEGCSGLTGSLIIPSSITSIDNNAFYGCSGLTSMVIFAEMPPTMGFYVFNGVSIDIPVYVPCQSIAAYQSAQGWNSFSNTIEGMCSSGTITVSSDPSEGGEVTGGGVYDPGALCTITASPNEGYTFICWKENDVVVSTQAEYTFTVSISRNLVAQFISANYISFVDANVKAICVANWDTNGDGELSYAEAAMVTSLGEVFRENGDITSFEELQYFIGLASISNNAFRNCTNLTGSLIIPNTVTSIGDYAFYGCSGLTGSLTIPNSVTSIGYCAFSYCSGFTGNLTISNSATMISGWAFRGCSGLTGDLIIPNSVTSIGWAAFSGCNGFTGSLTIPNSVTLIGDEVFRNCSGLTGSLTIPNSVTSIGYRAFQDCSGLTGSLTISNSITSIELSTFQNCSGLTGDLTIPNSVTSIGNSAFSGCSGFNGSLTIPNTVSSIESQTFYGCSGLTGDLTIPNSVTSIGNQAFYGCSGFNGSLTIPNTVTSIGGSAFQGCSGLTGSLTIPNSMSSIEGYTFYGCSGFLGQLTIPNSVTSIGSSVFEGCIGFTGNLTIPNSVTSIGNYAFYRCSGLTSLVIGNSVTSIDNSAFRNCSSLTSMTVLADNPPALGSNVFNNVNKSIPVYVPCGSLEAYQNATGWNEFTNIQELCTQSQTITLSEGWNWCSFNVEITLDDLKSSLVAALPGTNITIKSKNNGTSTYNGTTWRGQLTTLDVAQMYRISVSAACEITLEGTPINPAEHPITISNGANWIAFPFGESITVNDAFAGFAVSGDVVKSKENGIATYNGTQWRGTLNTLVPGQGYIYKSNVNEDRFFTFPIGTK